jgi:protein tyrosine/serine phosphatase
MPGKLRWLLIAGILIVIGVVPVVCYRAVYAHDKRMREVEPGKVYRSGQLTADGFSDWVQRLHIKTIIQVQDEYKDPDLDCSFFSRKKIKETELCRKLGVRYVYLPPDLIERDRIPAERPKAIDDFLAVMDDPKNYPVLIHCRAGLHRTGVLSAVYRMEYDGIGPEEAIQELKANGFGEWPCTSANDYIKQYILTYKRGLRNPVASAKGP